MDFERSVYYRDARSRGMLVRLAGQHRGELSDARETSAASVMKQCRRKGLFYC